MARPKGSRNKKNELVKQIRTNYSPLPDSLVFFENGTQKHVPEHLFLYAYTKALCNPRICADILLTEFAIEMTENAIRNRVWQNDELKEIKKRMNNQILDIAEEKLVEIFSSTNEKNRLEALKFYLDRQGSSRGWGKQVTNVNLNQTEATWLDRIDAEEIEEE